MTKKELERGLTAEEFESVADKIAWYFALIDQAEKSGLSENEKTMLSVIDNTYSIDDVIINPFAYAEYFGFCKLTRVLFPKLNDLIMAENDLFLDLLMLNNPHLDATKIPVNTNKIS